MVLVCHMIMYDHVTKWSYKFVEGSPLWLVTTLSSLIFIAIVVVEI